MRSGRWLSSCRLDRQFVKPATGPAVFAAGSEPCLARFGLVLKGISSVGRWQEPGWNREPLLLKLERRGIRRGEAEKRKHPLLIALCWAKPKPHFLKSPIFFYSELLQEKSKQTKDVFLLCDLRSRKQNRPFADIIVTVTIMPQPGRIRKC